MKLAKKRPLPILRRLLSSTRDAKHAMTKAIASVEAANRKLAIKRSKARCSLDEMLEGFKLSEISGAQFDTPDAGQTHHQSIALLDSTLCQRRRLHR